MKNSPFLNQHVLRVNNVGRSNKDFWKILMKKALQKSAEARMGAAEKSKHYRHELEPYVGRHVQLRFNKWRFYKTDRSRIQIAVEDGELFYVQDERNLNKVRVNHMLILTDTAWYNFVKPDPKKGLLLNGVLYQYITSDTHQLNIGIWAVTITPIED